MAPWLSIHSAPSKRGKGGGASHQRGIAFPTPAGRLYGFPAAKGGIKNGAEGAHLASTAILYNSRGRSPQPTCKAKPITGRTLAAQGQRPGGWLNPHARKGVSTYGNTGKRRPGPGPGPDRAERRLNPYAPKGVSHFPLSSFLCYNIGKFEPQSFLQGGLTYVQDSCCIRSSAAGSVAG